MSEQPEVKTIGEVERIVHASGMWDGTGPVLFSDDGETWTEAWAPSTTETVGPVPRTEPSHPEFARVEVYRKDVRIPTRVTIRWDEQYPQASPEWSAQWDRSPMRHFGRTARMVAFRQTFRDLLGNIVIEDEDRASEPAPADAAPAPVERDWMAEFDAAGTLDELDAVVAEARRARAFTPDLPGTTLDRYWKTRRRELAAATADAEPVEQVRNTHTAVQPARPAARDHQAPKSTATKRKRAPRKGGRR